ncbi:hypothetical protein [Bordetella sp. 2513F-2]
MAGSPYTALAALARVGLWLNGLAALMLAAFMVGVVGGDVAPPDLRVALVCYLAGMAASGCAAVFAVLAHAVAERRPASGGQRGVLLLAMLAFLLGLAAFGAGCWISLVEGQQASDEESAMPAAYVLIEGRAARTPPA